jgi:hypothetical protein
MMPLAINWTAVGSLSTGIAAIAAFCGILPVVYVYRRQDQRDRATAIRQQVRTISNDSAEVSTLTAIAVVSVSDLQIRAFRNKLGSSATAETFCRYFFMADNFPTGSSMMEGCLASATFVRLSDDWSRLDRVSSELQGALRILFYAARLTAGASINTCFPVSSTLILNNIRSDRKLMDSYKKIDNLDDLTIAISMELGKWMSGVYGLAFQEQIELGNKFITEFSKAVSNLTDRSLLRLAYKGIRSEDTETGEFIDDATKLITYLEPELAPQTIEEFRNQLDRWKESFSNEYILKKPKNEGNKEKQQDPS